MRFFVLMSFVLPIMAFGEDFTCPSESLIESPPVLSAKAELKPEQLKGDFFKVKERVTSDGFLNAYTLTSPFGTSTVRGTTLLREKENELDQLGKLKDKSTAGVVLNAAGKAGVDVITAPARAVGSLISAIRDPEGTWETIEEVPSGIVGLFEHVDDQASAAAKSVARAVSGEKKERHKERAKIKEQASEQSTKYALRWSGYSTAEKRWYAKLDVDPYTDNDQLRAEISRISKAESVVNIAFKFVPGVAGLSFVGDANKALKYSKEVAAFSDPAKLENRNKDSLKKSGYGEVAIKKFLANLVYTPTLHSAMVQVVLPLGKIKGSDSLLVRLGEAKSREAIFTLFENVVYLATLTKVKKIVSINTDFRLPVAVLQDRTAILALPLDTVAFTSAFSKQWCDFLNKAQNYNAIELRLRSAATPGLRAALDAPNIFLFEKVNIGLL